MTGFTFGQVPPPKALIFLLAFSACLNAFAQRGQIIKPATTTVMDPNQDGYVSLDASGFTGTGFSGYYSDEFELSMFGIPIVGSGEALGDNQAGASCGIADIIVDSLGYGAYAVLDAANNLTFRFRLGDHNPSVESYSILIDADGKLGTDDPNSTPSNPGFEIDITLIKNANKGVYLYNIDGIESCPVPLKNYSYHTNFQVSIADIITCSDLDYFYDFFIPFADLQTYFGFSINTEMRMVALTNVSGTCAMAGRISDVGGVNDDDYPGCPTCAFLDLGTNQCPTSLGNLCQTCGGFQSGVTPKPTIDQPVKAGENLLSGTAVPGAELFIDLFNAAHVLQESVTGTTGTGCTACPWSVVFADPMESGDIISARAKSSSGCSSGGVSSDATITIVVTNVPPQLSGAGTPTSYTENGVPLAIDANLQIIDSDNLVLESATASITTNFVPTEDILTFTPLAGVTGTFNATTGIIAFTGTASLTSYQALLRSISYSNNSDNPSTVVRSISFQVNDGLDNSNIVTRQVNVTSVNDAPIAADDSGTTSEELLIVLPNISVNDTDIDGTIVVTSIDLDPAAAGQQTSSTLAQGSWSVDGVGQVTFTPATNFNGTAPRTYTISDNAGATSNMATLTVVVTAINDAPVATNDTGTTNEDIVAVLANITANDTDLDGSIDLSTIDLDPTTAGLQPSFTDSHGIWTVDAAGNLTYSPLLNFNGTASISYVVADNAGTLSGTATITIQVLPVNDAPVATDDNGTTNENTPVILPNITTNDTDVDGTVVVTTIDLDPATAGQQTTSTQPQGAWSVDAGGQVTFTPVSNFNGTAIRSYAVHDDVGAVSNSATITVTVTSVNNLPIANDDAGVTNEDVAVTLTGITANDTDVDGTVDASTVDLDPGTAGQQTTLNNVEGSWTVNGAGNVTFTPVTGFVGDASATYTVNDNAGGTSNVATLLIRVNDVIAGNIPPVAVNDAITTDEETDVTLINITANDTDADGTVDPATVDLDPIAPGRQTNIVSTQGTWSVDDNADVTFVPAANFNGITSHIYTAQDDDGAITNSATIVITVNAVNDAPVANNDSGATNEATPALLALITSNDTDIDGTVDASTVDLDPLTPGLQSTFTSLDGGWSVDAAGNVTFTPVVNFNGTALASYTVNDNLALLSNIATLSVLVNATNDAPVANDDSGSTLEDTSVILPDLTANDTDADGTVVVASIDLDPVTAGLQNSFTNSAGDWSVDAAGLLTFVPVANFNGTVAIQYIVNDNSGATSNSATVTIQVDPVNDLPLATDDTGTTLEDTPVTLANLTSNDIDIDGTIDVSSVDLDPLTAGTQTTLTTSDGMWNIDNTASLSFSPTTNFNGIASLSYTVEDDQSALSNEVEVTITVEAVNDLPVLENLSFETIRNQPFNDNLIAASDVDPDGTILLVNTTPANPPDHGSILINADGTFTYTPAAGYVGTDLIEVQLCDQGLPLPGGCAIKEIHVTVLPSNTTPVIVVNSIPGATLNATTPEDTPVIVCFEAIDPDGDPVSIASLVNITGGGTLVQYGTLFYCFLYTPPPNFSGTSQWTLEACDNGTPALCGSLTITIDVTPVNDLPIAVDDNGVTNEGTPITLPDVTANDTDLDGTIDASTVDLDPVTAGQQTNVSLTQGTWSVDALGAVTFAPAANFNGVVVRSYAVSDNTGEVSNSANITIAVNAVNTLPVANNDAAVTNQDVAVILTGITANDTDVDGTVDASTVDLDPGTAGQQNTFSDTHGTWTVNGAGDVTFTPAAGFVGDASASYTVNDNTGGTSNVAALLVRVNAVIAGNTPPVAFNDTATTDEEATVILNNITSNDTDVDGNVDPATVDLDPIAPGRQTSIVSAQGTWSVNSNADVTFVPVPNFNGITSNIYTAQDDDGATTNSASITVTVTPVNDAPVATGDSGATNEGSVAMLGLITSNDIDIDGTVDAATVDLDPGSVGLQATITLPDGTWSVDAAGNVTFTPLLNFNGTTLASYTVKDNLGLASNQAVLTVLVNASNDAPVANDDTGSTLEDTPVSLPDLTANDTDVDNPIVVASVDLDPLAPGLQISITNSNGDWRVDASGVLTYEPVADFNGTAFVQYSVNDNSGAASNTATVTIVVAPVNDLPLAVDDEDATLEDTPVLLPDLTANDMDVDGVAEAATVDLDPLTPGLQNSITNSAGNWSVNTSGVLTYDPAANFNGTALASYTVSDDLGLASNVAAITVQVNAANDPPLANNDSGSTLEDTAVSLPNVTSNDTDLDNAIVAATVDLDPATPGLQNSITKPDGEWSVDAAGILTYDPVADFNGTASIQYIVDDNSGATSNAAIVTIAVSPVNDAPLAAADAGSTLEDTAVVLADLTINDTDIDGTVVTASIDLDPATPGLQTTYTDTAGDWTVDAAGALTYQPAVDFNGPAVASYVVNDDLGLTSNVAAITVLVNAANDPPVAGNDSGSTLEDTAVTLPGLTSNDTDLEDAIDIATIDLDPANSGLQTSFTSGKGEWTVDATGAMTYVPIAEFNGTASIFYVVNDVAGASSNLATITIVVEAVNDAPLLTDLSFQTPRNQPVQGTMFAATDMDPEGTSLTINTTPVVTPAHGSITINADGSFTYTPTTDYVGNDAMSIEICDLGIPLPGACAVKQVAIEIQTSNNPPVIIVNSSPGATLTATTSEDTPVVVCFRAVDPDGDPVTIGSISNTSGGGTLVRDGVSAFCYEFTPDRDFTGTSQWVLQACDNGTPSLCGTLTITIDVTPINDPPIARADTLRTLRNVEATLNVLANELDVEGEVLRVSPIPIRSVSHGNATLSPNGDLFYRSDIQFRGIDSLIYEVCDATTPPGCAQGKVVIIVDDLTLRVYEGISPNGDGVNDYLRIDGVDYYVDNEVQIFDRYSNLVFQISGYNNEDRIWYGQSNRGLGGTDLPEETYFYSIRLGDGGPPLTGFVVLKRR